MLVSFLLFHFSLVSAQDEPPDLRIRERLQVICHMLEQGRPNASQWWTGWLIGYSAATIGQGAVALASKDQATRQDMALGAATTCLGAIGQIIAPMVPAYAPGRLAGMPETTLEQRLSKLSEAEKLLHASALREKAGRSWKTHAIAGIVDLGSGLVVWLGFKRSIWEGVANFALNTAIAEAQIWTQPTRAMDDYNDYVNRYLSIGRSGYSNSKIHLTVHAVPGGCGLSILF